MPCALTYSYWEMEFQRHLRIQSLDNTLAQSRSHCLSGSNPTAGYGDSPDTTPCLHRTCTPLDLNKVRFRPEYQKEYHGKGKPRWQYQATKALPRVHPRVHTGVVVSDMTPNYLCSPSALTNIVQTIGTPSHFRLLILVRVSEANMEQS